LTGSSGGTTSTGSTVAATTNVFSGFSGPVAIDGSGNVWVANIGNGTVGTVSGDSNVTELSSTGSLIGTYPAGSYPYAIAIDGSGNIWVANFGSNTVTELVGVAQGVKTPLLDQPK
jgi:streptogramin lyase